MICMALKIIISVSATLFFSLFLSVYYVLCMPGALVSSLNIRNGESFYLIKKPISNVRFQIRFEYFLALEYLVKFHTTGISLWFEKCVFRFSGKNVDRVWCSF